MKIYNYLLEKRESGEIKVLFQHLGVSPRYLKFMEIYAFHLEHPKLSMFEVSRKMNVQKSYVWLAYQLMNQEVTW